MSRFKFIFILFWIIIPFNEACTQKNTFEYRKMEEVKFNFKELDFEPTEVVDYLPANYTKDGSKDYTNYIQKAIDNNQNIIFPDFPLLINDNGLELRSHSKIMFRKNSALILKASNKEKYSMLYLNGIESVIIYNPKLIGDRNTHLGEKGEWGMGIRINGSRNVKIYNVDIKDTWGDGIYIASSYKGLSKTENILVEHGHIDNARRDGISIIGGDNIKIKDLFISNTNGTHPASGIVLEPNRESDFLRKIKLENIVTFNNQNDGIVFNASHLLNKKYSPQVSVDIINHKDVSSRFAMRFSKVKFDKENKRMKGYVNVVNSNWINSKRKEVVIIYENSNLPQVRFNNVKVDKNQKEFDEYLHNLKQIHSDIKINNK